MSDDQGKVDIEEKPFIRDSVELFKHWFKTSSASGFCSVRDAFAIGRIVIDVGAVDPKTNKVNSSTLVYIDATEFAAYLDVMLLTGITTAYSSFGGGVVDGQPVSRSLRINPTDKGKFWIEVAHTPATVNNTGGYVPQKLVAPISSDKIQLTRGQLATLRVRLNLGLTAWTTNNLSRLKQALGQTH